VFEYEHMLTVARETSGESIAPSTEYSNGGSQKDYGWQKVPDINTVYEEVGRPQLLPSQESGTAAAPMHRARRFYPKSGAVPAAPSANILPDGTARQDSNGGTLTAYGEGVAVADVAKQAVGVFSHTGSAVMNAMPAGAIHAPSQPATGIGDDGGAPLYYEDEV
jgi:hypothetical protein